MYLRRAAAARMDGRSRLTRMNGAVTLHSCTSSISSASTSSTPCTQLLVRGQLRHQAAGVDRGAGRDPVG